MLSSSLEGEEALHKTKLFFTAITNSKKKMMSKYFSLNKGVKYFFEYKTPTSKYKKFVA